MSQNIKNNLFRFVTLRNPQLIDKKEEKPGFVFHPDEASGDFFSAIINSVPEDRKSLLKQAGENFGTTALKTRTEARSINEPLYLFSSWLMQHKNALTFTAIKENSTGITSLEDSSQLLSVWDNLIYQTIEKQSTYVREAMIQLLVANQFLNAFVQFSNGLSDDITFTEDQKKEFIRRANASVVMSKLLFSNTKTSQTIKPRTSESQERIIKDRIEVLSIKKQTSEYSSFLKELKATERIFNKTHQKNYQKALLEHNEDVQIAYDTAIPVIIQETDENGVLRDITTYPGLELPKFSFTKEDAISSSYLADKISLASLNIFNNEGLEVYDTFSEVESDIKAKIKENKNIINNRSPKNAKRVKIGGAVIKSSNRGINPYCFRSQYNTYSSGEHGFITEIATDYPNASIVEGTYKLVDDSDGTEYLGLSIEMMDSGTNTMTAFFYFNPVLMAPGSVFTFSGEFTLDNGDIYEFATSTTVTPRYVLWFNGCAALKDETPVEPTIEDVQMFGVTNLGIADFRRVEQEVCCYVPGEVSHIENVMAREYKERSTRSLVSSEVTTEKTDERERESLTDSSTTERNEMQTEVSSVLNEDQSQSQGGNANMNYNGKVSFSAGAYFDSSSASSTSDSNSQAQTYAQEVTERAMERIVEKTQTKRTSRILKEFEENNKHGFDNTKGSQHVTGVYRWVDKIYKNTLINYGKRLMYEFAIPEPSRFFKDAIWTQVENDELESGVIIPDAPIHPSLLSESIGSAADLTEDNYQIVAAKYNAEVSEMPVKEMSVGKSFSYTSPSTDSNSYKERNAESGDLDIPEGYYAYKAKAKWFDSIDSAVNDSVVIVGAKIMQINEGETEVDPYVGSIPVSFSQLGHLSGSANISVKLKVLPETEEAWINETYNAIMVAYYERLQEYNDVQNQDIVPFADKEKIQFNPLFNRSLEKNELKRIAIELLTEPYQVITSKDDYQPGALIGIKKDQGFQDHASAVKFFEQAFDWDIMAYVFYPYFYGKEANWKELFQAQDAADPLFQAFLQSGMARTVVPVRPGFEDAVNWYMETGEIWNGQGLVVDQDDDLYVSVAEEMQTIEGKVEGTWETRLPTSLTVIQAGSIGLDVEGLPCNEECNNTLFESDENPISQTTHVIGGEGGVGSDAVSGTITVQ